MVMMASHDDVSIERTPTGALPVVRPLLGWPVLVPRGGKWGDGVAAQLRALGASPVIAPLINFAGPLDPSALADEFRALEGGAYDWLVVTSATTVDVLVGHDVRVPPTVRIAAVGETTAQALQLAGFTVDFVPSDHSARGLVREWPTVGVHGAVLVPQSDIAEPTLVSGLGELGVNARYVSAYRTVGVAAPDNVVRDVAEGRIRALLVSSGSVARQIATQFTVPESTVVVCIGPRTAFDARDAGLTVHRIAEERSTQSLVRALAEHAMHPDDTSPPVVT